MCVCVCIRQTRDRGISSASSFTTLTWYFSPDQRSKYHHPQAKFSPLPGFVNKVLLEYGPIHSFMYYMAAPHYNGRVLVPDIIRPKKPKIFIICLFIEKAF